MFFSKRPEDVDPGFFESFTALSWKQENRRLQTTREDEKEKEKEKPPPHEAKVGIKIPDYSLSKKEKEELYSEVLYILRHRVRTSAEIDCEQEERLLQFANATFQPTPEEHERCLDSASKERPPVMVLTVTVLEAKDLEAKDPNGFSDPFCMLGIQPGQVVSSGPIPIIVEPEVDESAADDQERADKPKRSHSFRLSFKRKKDQEKDKDGKKEKEIKEKEEKWKESRDPPPASASAIPAKLICGTSVQPRTLNPQWNEKFKFDIDDIYSDRLHLDIWDHDDESSVLEAVKKLNEIQTWKGLGRYFKQIAQSARTSGGDTVDDFLGSVSIPLHTVPSMGLDQWFDLEGRSLRSKVQGSIHLLLDWSAREDIRAGSGDCDLTRAVLNHERLCRIFIDHEAESNPEHMYNWDGALPEPALTILHHQAILGDLSDLQQVMCLWIAYNRKHMQLSFNYSLLYNLLDRLNKLWGTDCLSSTEEEVLAESFSMFVDFCLSLLRKQRDLFPANNKTALHKLDYMLRCLALIQSMQAFWKCCPFHKEFHLEIGSVIKKGTLEWYEKMHALSRPQTNTEENIITSFIVLTNTLNTDLQRAVQHYNKLFEGVNVNYFSITYKQLDRLIVDDIGPVVDEMCDKLKSMDTVSADPSEEGLTIGTNMFELYMALQEFMFFKSCLPPSEQSRLCILAYPQWFTGAVTRWLSIARYKAMLRIKKSVEIDKTVTKMDNFVKHSTSAVDTTSCIHQIKIFWKQLAWPDQVAAYVFVTKILDDVSNGALYYTDLVYQKLSEAGFYDEEGQFDVTEQLCLTINNLEHVRLSLKPMNEDLGFDSILTAMEQSQGEEGASICRTALYGVLNSALEDMENVILKTVARVAEKMRPDLKKFVFHLAWAPDILPADEAIVPLMEYLDSNLIMLNSNLLHVNFERILAAIWEVVMQELQAQAESGIGEKQVIFFQRLHEALKYLLEFFHADEKGLSLAILHSDCYNTLKKLLDLERTETNDLIVEYYLEKLEQQKTAAREFGILTVRVYFHNDSLSIEILNARDILALDTNGYSDPFVIIELLPTTLFPQCPIQKTKIQKRTLHPLFDEIFEYPATLEQCKHEAAMIQFTVMDHDLVLSDDFAGEAYLSLNHIPGVDEHTEDITTLHGLKPVQMILMRSKQSDNRILITLDKRYWDKTAQEFVKYRKMRSA